MPDYASLAARYAGRPLLLTPQAARDLALRIRSVDPRAFQRPGRLEAFLRRTGLARGASSSPLLAMDDDGAGPPPIPVEEQLAYQPRWLGEVEDTGFCWSLSQGVALMECDSPLVERGDEFCGIVWHGYDTLMMAMREAIADARVRGIFLRLDTPGGVVAGGLPALARFMREAREEAGGKPIWIYSDMACSAGYWIAAQADRIIAPSVGYVGSIGAVMVHENYAGALEQDGIEITTIEFPEGGVKTDGAWWKKLSEAARKAWQADVNQVGSLFFADVEAGRPQLTADILAGLRADAFMADHADPDRSGLALGLADEILEEEEAFAALVEHVSEPASGTPPAAAPGSRASATQPKEAPVAKTPAAGRKAGTPAAQVAQAEKAFRLAQSNLNKAKAVAAAAEAEENPAEDAPADETPSDGDRDGDDDDDDGDDGVEGDPGDADESADDDAGKTEAMKISGSAEAKTHPHLAMAAINSGQKYAQFKATVAALGSAPRTSRLDAAMQGARRLGPDARGSGKSGMSAAVQARIDANRGRGGKTS